MRLSAALHRCAATVRRTATRLARTITRVVQVVRKTATVVATVSRRFSRLAVPIAVAACSRADSPAPVPRAREVVSAPSPVRPPPGVREANVEKTLGNFQLTFYFVTHEDEVAAPKRVASKAANDNATETTTDATEDESLAAVLPDLVPVYDRTCEPLSNVSRAFAAQLAMQGTGRLRDGRVLLGA